jgi:Family of unknown function (DUF6389)
MTRDDYIRQVHDVLAEHTARAAKQLAAALGLVPPTARKVEIEIFVDQDGEGFLNVRVSLDGPDLSVLNRAIASHAELFGTRMAPTGLEPALPLMEPGGEDFSVQDALTDCAAAWVSEVWRQAALTGFGLPVAIVSHDGYGTTTPIHLR